MSDTESHLSHHPTLSPTVGILPADRSVDQSLGFSQYREAYRHVASVGVTLVLSIRSRDSMWLVVDRRLSYGGRRRPIDDAVKVMNLETTDGQGLLAYAGLGATSLGTQPSEWMSAILRGRGGLGFEQALKLLSDAASRELPSHLMALPDSSRAHFIIIPAFVHHGGYRLYSVDNVIHPETGRHWYRYTRHVRDAQENSPSVSIALGGTGGLYLQKTSEQWLRVMLHLVKAHDRGKVSDHLVADQFARLNYEAHQAVRDGTVGPRCIVVWRRRQGSRRAKLLTGGGHQSYTGVDRDRSSVGIPSISNGLDVKAIGNVLMQDLLRRVEEYGFCDKTFDVDEEIRTRLVENLPSEPDEKLR